MESFHKHNTYTHTYTHTIKGLASFQLAGVKPLLAFFNKYITNMIFFDRKIVYFLKNKTALALE